MPIVFCSLEIHLVHSRSLKEKRNILRKLLGRLRSRFRFSISEIDYQGSHRRSLVGAVSIGQNRQKLEQLAHQLVRESERTLGGDLLRHEIEFFEYD